ncbi:PdaC/SigV domain-containing protein [Hyphomonas sp.]|uniref:DUF3298 and DUF4163 domain-containing protein n=1 Tax=Hyphomonas sp. TaxID=87 RepID=UPI00391B1F1A
MTRSLLTLSAAAFVLAACMQGEEVGPPQLSETRAAETASLPANLGSPAMEITNESFEGRAVVDPQIAAFDPQLAGQLMARAQEALEEMNASASRDQAEWAAAVEEGETGYTFRPYEMEVRHHAISQADGFISVQQDIYLNSGGAHPNYFLGGALYGVEGGGPVPITAIVADPALFGARLKAGLVEAKIDRGYEESARGYVEEQVEEYLGDDAVAGSEWANSYILNPSTEEGRFGGITVLFSPYDVGPYAEGSYEITIPAAELEGLLTPAWAARFGGEPVLPPKEE